MNNSLAKICLRYVLLTGVYACLKCALIWFVYLVFVFFMHNLFCFDILLFWNKVNNAVYNVVVNKKGNWLPLLYQHWSVHLWGMSWIPGWAIELDDFLMELFLVTTFTWPGSSSCNCQLLECSDREFGAKLWILSYITSSKKCTKSSKNSWSWCCFTESVCVTDCLLRPLLTATTGTYTWNKMAYIASNTPWLNKKRSLLYSHWPCKLL